MNIRGMAAGYTGAVNPQVWGAVSIAISGYVPDKTGRRNPRYADPVRSLMQVQALTTKDIAHVEALNIAGSTHTIYINGKLQGMIRAQNVGGDKIVLEQGNYAGRTFMVTAVLEDWPDWTKVSATMQNDT